MTDLQAQIPKRVQDEFDDRFAPRRHLVGAEEEKIDVGSRRQQSAPITAGGDHGQAFGFGRIRGVVDVPDGEIVEHLHHGVLQSGERSRRRQAGADARFHPFAHRLATSIEGASDMHQGIAAQLCLVAAGGARERRQIAPQCTGIEQLHAVQGDARRRRERRLDGSQGHLRFS